MQASLFNLRVPLPMRDEVFLMTKVCTHGRDASLAMEMLEQSLRRLQTDHLDLWQIHCVTFPNDPELFSRAGGAIELSRKRRKTARCGSRDSRVIRTLTSILRC